MTDDSESSSSSDTLVPGAWSWKEIGRLGQSPSPRHVMASAVWKDYLYIYGGYGLNGKHLNDFYRYSFIEKRWQCMEVQAENCPGFRHSASCVAHDGALYITSGVGPKSIYYDDIWQFDIERNAWKKLEVTSPVKPSSRWGHTTVVYKDELYLFGGFATSSILNDVWAFDFTTKTWRKCQALGKGPIPVHYHQAAVYGERMYIFGGFDGHQNSQELFAYCFETNHWQLVSKEMPQRRGHSLCVYNGCAYLFGGFGVKGFVDTLIEYSFGSNKFAELTFTAQSDESCPPRSFHLGALHDHHMYVFGGVGPRNLGDFFQFNFEGDMGLEEESLGFDLTQMVNNSLFSDITFVVEGEAFPAHRAIVYSRSSHFRALFSSGMSESRMERVALEGVSAATFTVILEYMYTGVLRCRSEHVMEVLIAADRFVIPGLKTRCEVLVAKGITESNAFDLAEFAQQHYATRLLHACFEQFSELKLTVDGLRASRELSPDLLLAFDSWMLAATEHEPYHLGPTVNPSRRTRRNRNYVRMPPNSRIPRQRPPVVVNQRQPPPSRLARVRGWLRRHVVNDREWAIDYRLQVAGWLVVLLLLLACTLAGAGTLLGLYLVVGLIGDALGLVQVPPLAQEL